MKSKEQTEKFNKFMDSSERAEVTFLSIEDLENMYRRKKNEKL